MHLTYNKYLFPIIYLILIVSSCKKEKEDITHKLFSKYEEQKGFFIFDVPPKLLGIFIEGETEENIKLKQVLGNLELIRVLTYNHVERSNKKKNDLFEKFNNYYIENNYNNVAKIISSKDVVDVKYFEKREQSAEMIILLLNEDSFVAISMCGVFDEDSYTTLFKIENIQKIKDIQSNN